MKPQELYSSSSCSDPDVYSSRIETNSVEAEGVVQETNTVVSNCTSPNNCDSPRIANEVTGNESCYERWILPIGAEHIIKQIAAEMIIHQMLNGKLGRPQKLECDAMRDLVTSFPAVCMRTYSFQWEDSQSRNLFPLAMLCCLKPPLDLVQLLYAAHPTAISTAEARRGSLPLHYACAFEASLEVVKFLHFKYEQAVSTPRKDQVYPLHLACGYYSGVPDVIHFLLEQFPEGAAKRCTDLNWYPLHSGAQGGVPLCVMEQLYNLCPKSVIGLDKYGKTPLHTSCRSKGNMENVEFLIRVGPEALHMEDFGHFKPIFLAAMYQNPQVLQLLLDRTPDRADAMGATLMHWAAVRNSAEMVHFLAQRFPEMLLARTLDRDRFTPLLGACLNEGSLESIRALIGHNPSTLFMADGEGRLPLEAAMQARASLNIVQLLSQEQEKYSQAFSTGGGGL